jgi:hypothetical protein
VVAKRHDRIEGVAEATQGFLLSFSELHGASIVHARPAEAFKDDVQAQ